MKTNNFIYVLGINPNFGNFRLKIIYAYILYNNPRPYTSLVDTYIGKYFNFNWESLAIYSSADDYKLSYYFQKGCLEPSKNKDNILVLREIRNARRYLCFENKKELVRALKQIPILFYGTTREPRYLKPRSIKKYQTFIKSIQETQEDYELDKLIKESTYYGYHLI